MTKRAYPISVNPLVRRGALGGIRTPNLLIRSQVLYPLSYERQRVRPSVVSYERAKRKATGSVRNAAYPSRASTSATGADRNGEWPAAISIG
jgi:hypothetical protein